ncbi:hypothetical protein QF019_002099 [Pseudomonas frederiksbergensis]|uniref:hypothetical protein n=1 Tax=Pseudomonas frederiksbergensis TaxID=104087 RepID=UPI003D20C44E
MSILWWEKTVEYFFIQKYVKLEMFVAPLDGNHERAGDAIFSHESSWVLIEFKRDQESISDELKKFTNYANAKIAMEPIGKHHLIIYGGAIEDDFYLKCQEYFSGREVEIDKALSLGVQKDVFIQYLKMFIGYKKQSKSGSGSFGFVAGVSSTGTVTKCMRLSEFAQALKLEKKIQQSLEQQPEIGNSWRSPGM